MGRRPKPLALHIKQGTLRLSRTKVSPRAAGELIKPPKLTGDASRLWDRVADFAASAGAGECDSDVLAGACWWYQEFVRCREALAELSPDADKYRTLQYCCGNAWRQFADIAGRFGLTPVDRAKLKETPDQIPSRLDDLFSTRK